MTLSIRFTANGTPFERQVDPRTLLADLLRHDLGLHGTHVGCEHGVCGACTVQLDGAPVRSCLMLAVQADGHAITTIEGLAAPESLHPLQAAFQAAHALQCGFCTPGILMTLDAFLLDHPHPDEGQIRSSLAGNICRCTGYQSIVAAVVAAARAASESVPEEVPHG